MENHLREKPAEPASTAVRRQLIIEELHQHDVVTAAVLSRQLGVSDVTIRKDLQQHFLRDDAASARYARVDGDNERSAYRAQIQLCGGHHNHCRRRHPA